MGDQLIWLTLSLPYITSVNGVTLAEKENAHGAVVLSHRYTSFEVYSPLARSEYLYNVCTVEGIKPMTMLQARRVHAHTHIHHRHTHSIGVPLGCRSSEHIVICLNPVRMGWTKRT